MKPGPRPTPVAILKQRGTFRPDRQKDGAVATGTPTCPSWLNKDAKKEFRRLVKMLGAIGVIGSVDGNALARYAATWVRWRQALQMIERGGEVTIYKDEAGKVKAVQPSAFNAIARGLAEQLDRLEQSMGLNPSARSRLTVQPPAAPAHDSKSRFFDGLN